MSSSPGQSGRERSRWVTIRSGGLKWRINPDLQSSTDLSFITEPDDFLEDPQLLLKNTRLVTIGRIPSNPPGAPGLVLRRLNYGRFRHQVRDFFRPSRAFRAMRHSLALEQAGLPVPRAVAVADVRKFRWPITAYFVTEEIPRAITLREHLARNGRLPAEVVGRLAQLFATLHSAGFIHGDTKSTNILLDERLHPWLIDLDGVRRFAQTPAKAAIRELARLALEIQPFPLVFKRSGLRFLTTYCRCRKIPGVEREWAGRVLEGMKEFQR